MREEIIKCDIDDREHSGQVRSVKVRVMFDHDQEDGRSKTEPYFEDLEIDMCDDCYKFMVENRRIIYAYGAMGHNKYYLNYKEK